MVFLILFVPCFIIFLAVFRIVRYYIKSKKYYRVKAVVIRNHVKYVKDGDRTPYTYYSPIVKFTDNNGIEQSFISSEDNPDRQLHEAGSTVSLLVNPSDPSRFIYDDKFDGYVISSIWLLIGAGLLFAIFYFG